MKLKGRRQSKNIDDTSKKTFAKAAKAATDKRLGKRMDERIDEIMKYESAVRATPREADNRLHGYDVDGSVGRALARSKNKGKVKR